MTSSMCPFCTLAESDSRCVSIENAYCQFIRHPHAPIVGSGVIVPKVHRTTVFDLTEEEWTATFDLLKKAKQKLDKAHAPSSYSVDWNTRTVAGQSVLHVHLHVIPRFNGEPPVEKDPRYVSKQPDNRRSDITERFAVKQGGRITFVDAEAIHWVEAAGDYVCLHTGDKEHLLNETMQRMEERLDLARFVRIHRSTIINTERLKEMQPYGNGEYIVVLADGTKRKLSRTYRDALFDFFGADLR